MFRMAVPQMQPLQFVRLTLEEQRARSQAFLNAMRLRRTVREFCSDPVPFEFVENAIRTACTAPSGANLQPWTFVVVSDPETKRAIREAAEVEERAFYSQRAPQEWLDALAPLGTDPNKPFLETAPYLIVVFAQHWGVRKGDDGKETKVKHYYATESVGLACGLLLASLHQAGLATLTHTPSPMGFLRDILERPANETPFLLIPVGYPAEGAQVPIFAQQKKSLDEVMVRC
jgi:iodotyrosine deiodinase